MIHIHYFITRKDSLDDAAFHRYWRETHGPLVKPITQLRSHVQSHRIPYAGSNSSYDGEGEVLIDSLATLEEMRRSKEYLEGPLADERNFIDLKRVEWMATRDHVIVDGPTGGSLVKGVYQLKKLDGMSVDEFRKYWIEIHGSLGSKLPGLRRYVQSHLVDEAYSYARPHFDGVAQLWFDSADAMRAAFDSPPGKALGDDGPKFTDMAALRWFVAQEHVVIAGR
ncbi:MAG TPA: EthD family reductase [Candidatus Binataceae bacterium]|nr:EthD family reductase [Candidatus Binataceae bacterium]